MPAALANADKLEDLAGQQDAATRLGAALNSGRLHHAMLFAGPSGVGKLTAAKLLARILMCTDRPDPAHACGRCSACTKYPLGGHPDMHVLTTEERVLTVDLVREATNVLHVSPMEGPHKIFVIHDADKMNLYAQNALLKTLEEPPGGARLILTSSKPRAILLTVLSRCLRVDFLPVPVGQVAEMLVEGRGLERAQAQLIAALCQGSPARAFDIELDAVVADRDRVAEIDRALDPGSERGVAQAIEAAQSLAENKDLLKDRLALLGVWLRDQIIVASGCREQIANADRRDDIEALAGARGLSRVLVRARALQKARNDLDSPFNLNVTLVLEQMCLAFSGHGRRV